MASSTVAKTLAKTSKDLVFVSETEAGFEPIEWKVGDASLTHDRVLDLADFEPDATITEMTLKDFFRAVPKADRAKFDKLTEALEANLSDIHVYKIGETECEVYIVGRAADGTVTGLKTDVVET
ncbi:MAG TPA: nuclease A inhibitor family protein [Gemmataceae bacterium]|jgi:hypothetical protein|nr:nuclease A inhibitor family protein [Gemmataceae bacterium]